MTDLLFPVQGPITSPFGARVGVNPLQHSDYHTGIDFGVPVGTPIYATHSGTFTTQNQPGGGGLVLLVNGPGGWQTVYAHTSRAAVQAGAFVQAGQLIGYSGATGNVTGPHLHYEVKRYGQHYDPRYTMPAGGLTGMALGAFRYDSTTAAAQQRRQLADIERARNDQLALEAQERKFKQDQARGILGEFAQIARSQRSNRFGIEDTPRLTRASTRSTRPSRFAV